MKRKSVQFNFDDLQTVVHHLKHSCEGLTKVKTATKRISNLTKMSEDKIHTILVEIARVDDPKKSQLETLLK